MKIYAYHLSFAFSVINKTQNYQFPMMKWADFLAVIAQNEPFEGQNFYIFDNNLQATPAQLLAFQSEDKWRNLPITLHFLFEDEAEKELFVAIFMGFFKAREAAGGIVQNEKSEYLFIFNREKWTFAKGHVEKGEEVSAAALREVEEETGLQSLKMGDKIGTTYHTFFKNKWKMKVTHWYRMLAESSETLVPQTEEYITDVRWISAQEWWAKTWETYPLVNELMQNEMRILIEYE
jgi:ADP-ribose pyrophosphatase YjhB (NUDIX family)